MSHLNAKAIDILEKSSFMQSLMHEVGMQSWTQKFREELCLFCFLGGKVLGYFGLVLVDSWGMFSLFRGKLHYVTLFYGASRYNTLCLP